MHVERYQVSWKNPGSIEKQRKNRDLTDHKSVKIGLNTQKNTTDLKRLAVPKIPPEGHK